MDIQHKLTQFKEQIHKVIVGNDEVIDLIFISLLGKGHILFESVPGTGKTVLSNAIAKAIGGKFNRVQFSPDVLPSDIVGTSIFNPKTQDFDFKIGPVDTNILLADEINRATPRTQSALLEVMEERQVTVDGKTHPLPEPFIILATQNQIESKQGTFDLPQAQMDRFFMKINLGYPSVEEELSMLSLHQRPSTLKVIETVFTSDEINYLQNQVEKVTVDESIKKYLMAIVSATREHDYIDLGISPRGALALMRGSIGHALIRGRDYVMPEDVKAIAPYILAHRLDLSIDGMTLSSAEQIISDILMKVEVPVEYGVKRDEV